MGRTSPSFQIGNVSFFHFFLFQIFSLVKSSSFFNLSVHYLVRESDSPVLSGSRSGSRSGSFGSPRSITQSVPISIRGPASSLHKFQDALEHKRRSQEVPNANYGSSPILSTLESDSIRSRGSFTSPPRPISGSPLVAAYAKQRPLSASDVGLLQQQRTSSRTSSGRSTPTYEEYPSEGRRSRSNTGPSEEVLAQTARTIAEIGDAIEEEYGNKMDVSTR